MRKALVVGINYYQHGPSLYGCVEDARAVKAVLDRNSDNTVNFFARLLTATCPADLVSRAELRELVRDLFSGDVDTGLLYFAGHGHIDSAGGYILTSDCRTGDDGLALNEILSFANRSGARNKVIILDSCHSGAAALAPHAGGTGELSEGMTILASSTEDQYAKESSGGGVFTRLLVDALKSAGNLEGDVTPGSVYAYIDQALGAWEQRPVFKTNIRRLISLRKIEAPITLAELLRIADLFPDRGLELPLDPSFEPERSPADSGIVAPDPVNVEKFGVLQKYARVNLVVPIGAPHMWHAAMWSKACKLTPLGEHYRRLVKLGRI